MFPFFSRKRPNSGQQPSLLCLRGETGTLACRVYDPLSTNLIPTRSKPWGRLKYAWLAEEKMHNLIAVRGKPGSSMVGPTNYFGDLDRSDQYRYTIDITPERFPVLTPHPINTQQDSSPPPLNTLSADNITKVNAKWFSGFDKEAIGAKKAEYNQSSVFGGNLFPNSGILEIDAPQEITLKAFDPKGVDLSAFKARLVPNDAPFQITAERLHVDDEYCSVSYQYDAGYADEQVQSGGGMFLESHEFAQTITPLDPDTSGFVTLAKWNDLHTQLELIAVQIPYGYTLIVDKNCIHGDTTLNGLFMMCMTSDHISMATADTVFLKHLASKNNINLKLDTVNNPNYPKPYRALDPLVFYDNNKERDLAYFNARTKDMSVIFTPTRGYWEVKQQTISTTGLVLLSSAFLVTAILLSQTMLILCLVMLSISILLAGASLYLALKQNEPPAENYPMPGAFAV